MGFGTCLLGASEIGRKNPGTNPPTTPRRTQKGSQRGLVNSTVCSYPRDLGSRPGCGEIHREVEFIETHRICVHMFPRSVPPRSRYRLSQARFRFGHRFHFGSTLGSGMLCKQSHPCILRVSTHFFRNTGIASANGLLPSSH